MKIIDLLNKIANSGEVPKKIKRANMVYEYSQRDEDYINKYDVSFMATIYCSQEELNKEIEILEEEKKIPEKIEMIGCNVKLNILGNEMIVGTDTPLATETCIVKINSIIDYLKSKGE